MTISTSSIAALIACFTLPLLACTKKAQIADPGPPAPGAETTRRRDGDAGGLAKERQAPSDQPKEASEEIDEKASDDDTSEESPSSQPAEPSVDPSDSSSEPTASEMSETCAPVVGSPLVEDAKLVEVALPQRFEFLEGPVWSNAQQTLYLSAWNWSDATGGKGPPSVILALETASGTWRTFSQAGVRRSNGLALDAQGDLMAALHGDQGIGRISLDSGATSLLSGSYQGKPFNSPNDLTVRKDGNVYFTDPSYQADGRPGQGVTGVYRITGDGAVTLIDSARQQPNGIALSPDGRKLYVGSAEGRIFRYDVAADGSVGAAFEFASADGQNVDGMTVDCMGNVYAAIHSAQDVRIFAPTGALLSRIAIGVNVTNLAFGGQDGKTLFVTTAGRLFRLEARVAGSPF